MNKEPIQSNRPFSFIVNFLGTGLRRVVIISLISLLLLFMIALQSDMAAEDLLGAAILFVVGSIATYVLMLLFKWVTGISCLQAVDLVGKYTLLLIDFLIHQVKELMSLGLETDKISPEVQRAEAQLAEAQLAAETEWTLSDTLSYAVDQDKQAPEPPPMVNVRRGEQGPHPDPFAQQFDQPLAHIQVAVDEHPRATPEPEPAKPAAPERELQEPFIDPRAFLAFASEAEHPLPVWSASASAHIVSTPAPDQELAEPEPQELAIAESQPVLHSDEAIELLDQPQALPEVADAQLDSEVEPQEYTEDHLENNIEAADHEHDEPLPNEEDDNLVYWEDELDDVQTPELDDEPVATAETGFVADQAVKRMTIPLAAANDDQLFTEPETPVATTDVSYSQLLDEEPLHIQPALPHVGSFIAAFPPKQPGLQLPSLDLLEVHEHIVQAYSEDDLEDMSRTVERVLNDYKVTAEVVGAYPGPIITRFELSLAPGVKVSRVSTLAKDLARAMLVTSVRVVEIIEGTPYIGLEIPNQERELVSFRDIISSETFVNAKSPLTMAIGKDVSGEVVIADLAKMPHLLVAGTTGSGKSVAINTMILSMLYKAKPEQVRMIMIDPKMLELSIYEGIPHLLTPVVTDMKQAHNGLRWAVAEMERRYKLMSKLGVRNLAGFNYKIKEAAARGEQIQDPLFQLNNPLAEAETIPSLSTLPQIVIVIDELADMMMIVGKKVEELIARLAQKARAAGIHLILATQRPSVDVLTGLIKANVPTRMSFQVSSRIDSRTILDQGGAESLLGNGDMLFLPSGTSMPLRAHGAFVGDNDVHQVVNYLKSFGGPRYIPEILHDEPPESLVNKTDTAEELDPLYNEVVDFVLDSGKASISSVQRRFKVGYNRAARMIEQMQEDNMVSEPDGANGSRRIIDQE